MLLGLTTAIVGIGFANPSASGTGVAATGVGLWTMLALPGAARRQSIMLIGLTLAWAWLWFRLAVDWNATAGGAVVLLFLIPTVSIPVCLAWAVLTAALAIVLLGRTVAAIRRGSLPHAPGLRRSTWALVPGTAAPLALLVLCTLAIPHGVSQHRGRQIQELARRYAPPAGEIAGPTAWGACSLVFLGYELTQHGAESTRNAVGRQRILDRTLADAKADLASIAAAGARYVRLGASGDHLLESRPDQERLDDLFLTEVRNTGMELVLVDTQHPQALRTHRLDWPAFCRFQRQRIEYYQRRYQPKVYIVACEPMSYHHFALAQHTRFSADAWAAQLADLCRLVKSINPATQTGLCLLVTPNKEPEWEVWTRLKNLPELDILSVEIYAPEHFHQTEDRLRAYGHPLQNGKAFWIAETYNGWALCGQRRWDQDAAWINLAADFARRVEAEAVLVWTFGTFVPRGHLLSFGRGQLRERWGRGDRLSPVGEAFLKAQTRALAPGSPP